MENERKINTSLREEAIKCLTVRSNRYTILSVLLIMSFTDLIVFYSLVDNNLLLPLNV